MLLMFYRSAVRETRSQSGLLYIVLSRCYCELLLSYLRFICHSYMSSVTIVFIPCSLIFFTGLRSHSKLLTFILISLILALPLQILVLTVSSSLVTLYLLSRLPKWVFGSLPVFLYFFIYFLFNSTHLPFHSDQLSIQNFKFPLAPFSPLFYYESL